MRDHDAALRFQKRAERLRTIASGVKEQKFRDELLQWAQQYDQWAQRAIEHVGMSFPDRKPKKLD